MKKGLLPFLLAFIIIFSFLFYDQYIELSLGFDSEPTIEFDYPLDWEMPNYDSDYYYDTWHLHSKSFDVFLYLKPFNVHSEDLVEKIRVNKNFTEYDPSYEGYGFRYDSLSEKYTGNTIEVEYRVTYLTPITLRPQDSYYHRYKIINCDNSSYSLEIDIYESYKQGPEKIDHIFNSFKCIE